MLLAKYVFAGQIFGPTCKKNGPRIGGYFVSHHLYF